jgi:predicted nucleotidyltransferase
MAATTVISRRCKRALQDHYGAQFRGLVLYGSAAQRKASAESDIDLIVLLNRPFDHLHELRQIVDLLYPIQLESERLISVQPAAFDEFEEGRLQLYRNAKRQGRLV